MKCVNLVVMPHAMWKILAHHIKDLKTLVKKIENLKIVFIAWKT